MVSPGASRSPSPVPVAVAADEPAHPQIKFEATPDLTQLAIEKLGRHDDKQTFCESYWSVMRTVTWLKDWKQLSTLRKVWAVVWRIFTGLPLLVALFVPIIAAGPCQYWHNHKVTLDGSKNALAEKASKVFWSNTQPPAKSQLTNDSTSYDAELTRFEESLWNRLRDKTLAPFHRGNIGLSPDQIEKRFAYDLRAINMETFIESVFTELDNSLATNSAILPQTKMRMAYDICEHLWERYKAQMEHYPWLENPDDAAQPITPEQARDAAAKMVYQRIAMNTALMKYWVRNYKNRDAVHGHAKLNDWLGFDRARADGNAPENLNQRLRRLDPDFVRAEVAGFLERLDYEPFMPARAPRDAAMIVLDEAASKLENDVPAVEHGAEPEGGFSPEVIALIAHYDTPANVNAAIDAYGVAVPSLHLTALRRLRQAQQDFANAQPQKDEARAIIQPLKQAMERKANLVTRDSIIAARAALRPPGPAGDGLEDIHALVVTDREIAAEKRKFTTIQHNLGNHPDNTRITDDMLTAAGIPAEEHANIRAMHAQYFDADLIVRTGQANIDRLKKAAALLGISAQKRRDLAALEAAQGEVLAGSRAAYQAVIDQGYRGNLNGYLKSNAFISSARFVPIAADDHDRSADASPLVRPLARRVFSPPSGPMVVEIASPRREDDRPVLDSPPHRPPPPPPPRRVVAAPSALPLVPEREEEELSDDELLMRAAFSGVASVAHDTGHVVRTAHGPGRSVRTTPSPRADDAAFVDVPLE